MISAPRRSRTLPVALVLLLCAGAAGRALLVWPRLPARMASHFAGDGRANGWMPRGAFFGTMASLYAVTVGLLLVLPLLLDHLPVGVINLPHRDYWLAPERRSATLDFLGLWMAWFSLATTLLLVIVLELVLRANLAGTGLPPGPMKGVVGLYLALAGLWIFRLIRRFRLPG